MDTRQDRAESAVKVRRERALVSRLARTTSRIVAKDWIGHLEAAIQKAIDDGPPPKQSMTQPLWREHCIGKVAPRALALLICDAVLRPRPEDKDLTDWAEQRGAPSCQTVANDIGGALKLGASLPRAERKRLRDTVGMELLNIAFFAGLIGPLQSGVKGTAARCVLSDEAQAQLAEIHTALILSGELLAEQPVFSRPAPLIDMRANWRGLEPPVNEAPDVIKAVHGMQSVEWRINQPLLLRLLGDKDPTAEVRKALSAYAEVVDARNTARSAHREATTAAGSKPSKYHARKVAGLTASLKVSTDALKAARAALDHWITLLQATALQGKTFWYRVRLDYRGRLYQIGGRLQYTSGDDLARALLEFANGAPLNDQGREHLTKFIAGLKPDDDPYRLQAATLALESSVCHFPVALDCTQSGLQTYALLMRDKDLGAKANVYRSGNPADVHPELGLQWSDLPADHPQSATQDFYGLVAKDVNVAGIDRRDIKALGNPQIYGAGLLLQTKRLAERLGRDPSDKTVRKDAKKIRAAILRLAPAFATLSAWLRGVAALASANNLPVRWEHSDGFVVLQDSRRLKKGRDHFYLPGHKRSIDYATKEPSEAIDTHAQERQAAANYVHSYDAMLLREVLRGALSARLAVACAHDSFACHPNELATLRALMVEALGTAYSDSPLARLHGELQAQRVFELPGAHIPQMDAGFQYGDLAT